MMTTKDKTHMNELLPKPHLRTSDIPAAGLTVTPKGWGLVKVYDRQNRVEAEKGVLYFRETTKYLIMNDTRVKEIKLINGSEFIEDWYGKPVNLVVEKIKTGFGDKDAIWIKRVATSSNGAPPAAAPPAAAPAETEKDRYTQGKERKREQLWSLIKELGIDGEQGKALVKELGDYSAAYDYLLQKHAEAIFKKGTTERTEK